MVNTVSRISASMLLLGMALMVAPAAHAAFGFADVVQKARALAAKPYQQPVSVPALFTKLDVESVQQIRFKPEDTLWSAGDSLVQLVLTAPAKHFRYPVVINVVDAGAVHRIPFHREWFTWPDAVKGKVPNDLGYAGFRLTFPLDRGDHRNEFLSFAGASYFRGVAQGETFGLSGRGIAVDTGLASGEEFPRFTEFWLVRPTPDATTVRIYALLDGASITGAYQFDVHPGTSTRVEVHAHLFMRKDIKLLGLAPLTSMFFYGSNTPRPGGQLWPAVHDSDGLLIHSHTGEWLWRPLINPPTLQMNYLDANSPQGFGLLQRDTRFADYQDTTMHYEDRPSAWVEPHGDWGKGRVVLVEIPTDSETNDNIVAFWSPGPAVTAGEAWDLHYTLTFGPPDIVDNPMAHAVATYVGLARTPQGKTTAKGYHIVVDFAGGPLARVNPNDPVTGMVTGLDGTKVVERTVHWIAPEKRWRLSILATPASGKPLALRAFLTAGSGALSETWTYALPVRNRFDNGH